MFSFNYLFKFLLVFSALAAEPGKEDEKSLKQAENGWVVLDQPIQRPVDAEIEEDSSVWVIFSKQLGDESFRVRFPVNPEYRYISSEEMEIFTVFEERAFSLHVLRFHTSEELTQKIQDLFSLSNISLIEVSRSAENIYDIQYREEGMWVKQRYFSSQKHLYILQTKMALFDETQHDYFVSSFEI